MGRTSTAKERLLKAAIELIWAQSYGSVTIDALCEQAGVKKGSFYYFFPSKAELVTDALEAAFEAQRAMLDQTFSPSVPPLDRIRDSLQQLVRKQLERYEKTGQILGCPYCSVGCEVSQLEELVRAKVQDIMQRQCKYFETALRDAQAEGSISVTDVPCKARRLGALIQGVLVQARIQNDPALLTALPEAAMEMLGATSAAV